MGLDLGRVQGAGWFHTSAASSTSISISSLQPQLTPFVGDAVAFPNGDVRQITAVSGSTVTLGGVLFSYKGDPGIGNATLSNVDGDSTTDGFTQAAVKGIAQAKNYYNLNEYDTYVSNGDGTANNQRYTKYLFPHDLLLFNWFYEPDFKRWAGYAPDSNRSVDIKSRNSFKNNLFPYYNFGVGTTNAIGVFENGTIYIVYQDAADLNDFKAKVLSKLFIQYQSKTSYTEQVIENQPIRTLDQNGEWWLHEEWRKGLNLCPTSQQQFPFEDFYELAPQDSLTVGTYTILITAPETDVGVSQIIGGGITRDDSLYVRANIPTTFTTKDTSQLLIYLNSTNIVSIMLTRGTIPYPYKPYYGSVVREKDLSGIQLFPADVNPAQTIGGDWEDKGTVTTSDNTVFHAYRRL